ncbi:hypothetical protein [Mameliella alba]|uniref:hypothetical protein n=1 Tax=Mameliella alba TaxID=561184 RepID=UPI00142F8CCF|nr:hypothetical protein [Mameliella alba]
MDSVCANRAAKNRIHDFQNKLPRHPFATTLTLSLKEPSLPAITVLLYESSEPDAAELDKTVLRWTVERAQSLKLSTVSRGVKSLCRLINFVSLRQPGGAKTVEEQSAHVFSFVDYRQSGTLHLTTQDPLHRLYWAPVGQNTAKDEFRDIVEFFIFLERDGFEPKQILSNQLRALPASSISTFRNAQTYPKDMYNHLIKAREFWSRYTTTSTRQMPTRGRLNPQVKTFRQFPPKAEVDAIIEAEPNPTFRAIWLVLAYGGSHRVSEILNLWQCDVLPSHYRREFFGVESRDHGPLVLIAHPSESTYLGAFDNRKKTTREAFLKEKYNLTPRNKLSNYDKLFAGFKTKALFGTYKTADTFWLDSGAAYEFHECAEEIRRFHTYRRTSRFHPYFLVNTMSKGDSYGMPLKKNRLDRAWQAACRRVGIEPNVRGRNIQGLRHFSKAQAESLNLSPRQIQLMRGDMNISSQDDYGADLIELRSALLSTYERTGAN